MFESAEESTFSSEVWIDSFLFHDVEEVGMDMISLPASFEDCMQDWNGELDEDRGPSLRGHALGDVGMGLAELHEEPPADERVWIPS